MTETYTPIMLGLKEASEKSGLSYSALRTHIRVGKKYLVNWGRLLDYLNGDQHREEEGAACLS